MIQTSEVFKEASRQRELRQTSEVYCLMIKSGRLPL